MIKGLTLQERAAHLLVDLVKAKGSTVGKIVFWFQVGGGTDGQTFDSAMEALQYAEDQIRHDLSATGHYVSGEGYWFTFCEYEFTVSLNARDYIPADLQAHYLEVWSNDLDAEKAEQDAIHAKSRIGVLVDLDGDRLAKQ